MPSFQMFKTITSTFTKLYKIYVMRDPFLWTVKKWFADRGDETLRLDYPLEQTSVVFDVGGYLGDYADAIHRKYGCQVYVFEPVPAFYAACVKRFRDNPSITCLNYGLSSASGWFEMSLADDGSSFKKSEGGSTQKAQIRAITDVVSELGIDKIDLIKINIEGGEYDLLPAIVESGLINRIKFVQVQFHDFIAGAIENRQRIRASLQKTHREMWNYEFVWESWELN